jgi:hypothetical protein
MNRSSTGRNAAFLSTNKRTHTERIGQGTVFPGNLNLPCRGWNSTRRGKKAAADKHSKLHLPFAQNPRVASAASWDGLDASKVTAQCRDFLDAYNDDYNRIRNSVKHLARVRENFRAACGPRSPIR